MQQQQQQQPNNEQEVINCANVLAEIGNHEFIENDYNDNIVNDANLGSAQAIINKYNMFLKKDGGVSGNELMDPDKELVEYVKSNEFRNLSPEQKEQIKKVVYNLFKNQMYLMAILICKHFQDAEIDGLNKKLKASNPFIDKVLKKLEALNKVKKPFIDELARATRTQSGGDGTGEDDKGEPLSQTQISYLLRKREELEQERRPLQVSLSNLENIQSLRDEIEEIYRERDYAGFSKKSFESDRVDKLASRSSDLKVIENLDSHNKIFGVPMDKVMTELENEIRNLNYRINEINRKLNESIQQRPPRPPRPSISQMQQRQSGGTLGNLSYSKFMYKASKYLYLTDKAYNNI
jgi:hypothetical protein